jgi:hypothetical protein
MLRPYARHIRLAVDGTTGNKLQKCFLEPVTEMMYRDDMQVGENAQG